MIGEAEASEGPDLAGLVASRLCHDLVSPIGAIGNGVELLGMSGVAGPETDLIGESVEGASARIRFYRIAFGAALPGQTIDGAQLSATLAGPHGGGRVRMSWRSSGDVPREEARLALLLLLCAEAALVEGGEAEVTRGDDILRIGARGPVIRAAPSDWAHLTGGDGAEPTSGTVQFALAAAIARSIGAAISVETGADRIVISVRTG